jgi:DNA-binding NarL/FixJ family response regulator
MKKFLSQEEIFTLEDRHKTERDKRVADRIKAVLLLHKEWQQKDIAEALLISPDSVSRHIEQYLSEKKLKPTNGGSKSKLNAEQTSAPIAHLEKNMYILLMCFEIPSCIFLTILGMK